MYKKMAQGGTMHALDATPPWLHTTIMIEMANIYQVNNTAQLGHLCYILHIIVLLCSVHTLFVCV